MLLNGENNNNPPAVSTNFAAARQSQQKWGNEHRAATESLGDEARFEDKRERLFIRRRHNCFLHCDFPSECHHSLFRAQQEGRPILREAEALDAAEAAREAECKEGKRRTRRLTVQEYKQRRAERRTRSVSGAATAPVAGRFVEDLSTVTEEETEHYEEGDTISPCSPTSPDPTGDLMREVSPVETDNDSEQPLSPSGRSRRERASLLVTTDTPVDFASTAAPLSFEDTYSDEEFDDGEDASEAHEDERRRIKSRRKAAQPTDEHPESLGPFILDTSAPSPTSPLSAAAPKNNIRAGKAERSRNSKNNHHPTALDLQAAWSEQAWFSSSTPAPEPQPSSPKSPERVGTRDRMFALLGRRGSASPTSPGLSHDGCVVPLARVDSHSQQQHQPHQADATAVAVAGEEEWESWSDSSTSSTSSTSSGASLLSSSSAEHGAVASRTMDITDADGDVPMPDFTAPSCSKGVDNDMDSMTPPTGRQRAGARRGDDGTEEDLRALLRMRNAFMRGEML